MRLHTKDIPKLWLAWIKYKLGRTRKVDFVVAGAQKCGTSALHDYLETHPDLCMGTRKEVHFFDDDRYFKGLQGSEHKYHYFFKPTDARKLLGDCTPAYMYFRKAAARMHHYNPDMKIIMILRNPIERTFSHWNMQRARKRESRTFWDTIQCEHNDPDNLHPGKSEKFLWEHRYIRRSLYSEQIERIRSFFPKTQVIAVKTNELRYNPKDTLKGVYEFLDVSIEPISEVEGDLHSYGYVTQMTEEEWDFLRNIFVDEVHKLEKCLGWDCSEWLESPSFSS